MLSANASFAFRGMQLHIVNFTFVQPKFIMLKLAGIRLATALEPATTAARSAVSCHNLGGHMQVSTLAACMPWLLADSGPCRCALETHILAAMLAPHACTMLCDLPCCLMTL